MIFMNFKEEINLGTFANRIDFKRNLIKLYLDKC